MLSGTHGHNLSNVMAGPIPSYGFRIRPIRASDTARVEVTAACLTFGYRGPSLSDGVLLRMSFPAFAERCGNAPSL
jgi:hypothetical protein